MIFIKNGTDYPRHIGDIQNENPEWEFGQALPSGWELVEETEIPERTAAQRIEETFPEQVDGVWKQRWSVVDLTEAELAGESTDPSPRVGKFDLLDAQSE